MRRLIALTAFTAAACGGPVEDTLLSDTWSEVAAVPTLTFFPGWTQNLSGGALVQGGQVRVRYAAERLPECRGDQGGRPAWAITAFTRLDGGPVVSRVIHGFSADGTTPSGEAIFDLPSAGELEVWFQVGNRWGCSAYDSDFGRNFRYTVLRAPTAAIQFAADWSEQLVGELRAGSAVNVEYALSRLPSCRQGYNGLPTWEILAYYRFDGGAVAYVPATQAVDGVRRSAPTPIAIPADARTMELWFYASDRGGCREWDSDFGRNYRFELSR